MKRGLPGSPLLVKCNERFVNQCDPGPTDLCCTVIPCEFCLRWDIYGQDSVFGHAQFFPDHNMWLGEVPGVSLFQAYWERDVYGVCVFRVFFGYEISSDKKIVEITCQDPSGTADVTLDYDTSGTLTWTKRVFRPLQITEVEGCTRHFCGNCECTCEELCVVLTMPVEYGSLLSRVFRGVFADVSYMDNCQPPNWCGVLIEEFGYQELQGCLELSRDTYTGECLISGYVDGLYLEPITIGDCKTISAAWLEYDGTEVSVSCKKCGCFRKTPFLCECRLDSNNLFTGAKVSGGTVCTITPVSSILDSSPPASVPTEKYAWRSDWCFYSGTISFRLTAFPPDCVDPDVSRKVVIVKKTNNEEAPFINNVIVELEDWYMIVYNNGPTGDPSIYYEYAQCCLDATPQTAASSHLVRVQFFNVTVGDTVYDFTMLNPTTLATYGDCG